MRTISAVDTFDFDVLRVPWCGRKAKKRVKEEGSFLVSSTHTHTNLIPNQEEKSSEKKIVLGGKTFISWHNVVTTIKDTPAAAQHSEKILIYSNFSPFSLDWRGLAQAQQIPNHRSLGAKVIDEKIIWLIEDSPSRLLMNLMGLICLMLNFLSRRSTLIKFAAAPLCLPHNWNGKLDFRRRRKKSVSRLPLFGAWLPSVVCMCIFGYFKIGVLIRFIFSLCAIYNAADCLEALS